MQLGELGGAGKARWRASWSVGVLAHSRLTGTGKHVSDIGMEPRTNTSAYQAAYRAKNKEKIAAYRAAL